MSECKRLMLDAQTADRINYLKQKEKSLLDDLENDERNIEEMYTTGIKRKRIEEWYDECKERVSKGDPEITHENLISIYMRNKMQERNIRSGSWYVYKIIDEHSKRHHNKSIKSELAEQGLIYTGTLENSNAKSYKGLQEHESLQFKKPIAELDHNETLDAAQQLIDNDAKIRALQARQRDLKIEIAEHAEKNRWTDVKVKVKATSADKPDPRAGPYYRQLFELADAIYEFAEKVKMFPPDQKDEARYINATAPYLRFMQFLKDDKYNQSAVGWMATIKTMEASHKHAAAVLHGTNARLKEFYEDEETGETKFRWIEIPRAFTREQVGDQREGMLDLAIEIVKGEGAFYSMAECKDKYAKPYLSGRKVKMHDEFSDKAFSGGGNLSS